MSRDNWNYRDLHDEDICEEAWYNKQCSPKPCSPKTSSRGQKGCSCTGPTGPKGEIGPMGLAGSQGPRGLAGPKGDTSPSV